MGQVEKRRGGQGARNEESLIAGTEPQGYERRIIYLYFDLFMGKQEMHKR